MKIRLFLVIATLSVAQFAHASCSGGACNHVYVERLYVHSNYIVYVATDGDEVQLNCTPIANGYLALYHTDSNYASVYSLLLAAQLADKKVSIRIVDGSSNCKITYALLDRQ